MNPFSSLTNRIFVATALLAVLSMGVAIYIVNRAVTKQGALELQRGIDEAGTLVDEYRKFSYETFGLEARLIADLPVLKAAVDIGDPATLEPIAREYQKIVNADDLFAIADNRGRVVVRLGTSDVPDDTLAAVATIGRTEAIEREASWPEQVGILLIKSVPIWIDKRQPDVLGTLIMGRSLDYRQASRFKSLTNSEIAFGTNGEIKTATLPKEGSYHGHRLPTSGRLAQVFSARVWSGDGNRKRGIFCPDREYAIRAHRGAEHAPSGTKDRSGSRR